MVSFFVAALLAVANARLAASQRQQALSAGSAMRTRYIQGLGNNITGSFPIAGISTYSIDNTQLQILTADEDYTAASAQAFMQGLYPPLGVFYKDDNILLANGNLVEYPLQGYQYATIDTISSLDFNYVWYVVFISGELQTRAFP
jgi:Histidine phosphatase superfamily (branch 2)